MQQQKQRRKIDQPATVPTPEAAAAVGTEPILTLQLTASEIRDLLGLVEIGTAALKSAKVFLLGGSLMAKVEQQLTAQTVLQNGT